MMNALLESLQNISRRIPAGLFCLLTVYGKVQKVYIRSKLLQKDFPT